MQAKIQIMHKTEQLKDLYNNELLPSLKGMEDQRKSIRLFFSFAPVVIIIFIFVLPFVFPYNGLIVTFVIIGILCALTLAGIGVTKFFTYRNQFKKEVVVKVVNLINPHYYYNADKHISNEIFNESKLSTKLSDRSFGDDFISGRIDKTDFEFSELKASIKKVTTENGKSSTTWDPIFEGLFFHADFNKIMGGETFVLPDKTEKLFGKVGQKLQNFSSRGELVKLENPVFEKEFKVYSSSQQEARYVLTPTMMEAMVNIKKQFNRKMMFSFKGNRVYCGILFPQGLFEPKIFTSGINYKAVEEMYFLFGFIETIITEMNLNTRIWTKS